MFTRKGEQLVGKGTYWDVSTGQRIELKGQGMLPGDKSTTYIKAPSAVVLLFGPILGLLYAIFLPSVGIAMAIALAVRKVVGAGEKVAGRMINAAAKNLSFGWQPVKAYLAGKRKARKGEKEKGKADTPK